MNNQPSEKRIRDKTGTLQVHSIFLTIQGEGPFAGTPAVFVRLAGCNLQCPMCDTDYTTVREHLSPKQIVRHILDETCLNATKLVVITGGEPFRQDITELIVMLVASNAFFVQVETNGTLSPQNIIGLYPYVNHRTDERSGLYVVVSPKTGKVHADIWEIACCAKYVGAHDSLSEVDGLPNEALNNTLGSKITLARPPRNWRFPIYLQPMDWGKENDYSVQAIDWEGFYEDKNFSSLAACRESCMKHGYILQLQLHKILGMP